MLILCFSVCQLVYNSVISVRYISHYLLTPQDPQRTAERIPSCWWERLTVTSSARTSPQGMCWRLAAAGLRMQRDRVEVNGAIYVNQTSWPHVLNLQGKTPFCPPTARFTKAEPEDVLIVCGEFDTDVESIITSVEPEEVFKVTEIINHPSYTPNRVIFPLCSFHDCHFR